MLGPTLQSRMERTCKTLPLAYHTPNQAQDVVHVVVS
jgi:hypothetical protein